MREVLIPVEAVRDHLIVRAAQPVELEECAKVLRPPWASITPRALVVPDLFQVAPLAGSASAAGDARAAHARRMTELAARPAVTTVRAQEASRLRVQDDAAAAAERGRLPFEDDRCRHAVADEATLAVRRAHSPFPARVLLPVEGVDDDAYVGQEVASRFVIMVPHIDAFDDRNWSRHRGRRRRCRRRCRRVRRQW